MENTNIVILVLTLVALVVVFGHVIIFFVDEPWQTFLFYPYIVAICAITCIFKFQK